MTEKYIEDSYQLSPMQQGMLFNSLYAQNSGVDIEQMVCTVSEKLDISAFQAAWNRVVQRHAVLRTSFDWANGSEPLQQVHKQVTIPFQHQDLRDLSAAEQSIQLESYLQRDRINGFELDIAPLMRLALFQISDSVYQFVWTFHHIILDGRSLPIILDEVFTFYDAFCQGHDIQLPNPCPYQEHMRWLQQQDWSKSEGYWRQFLKGFSVPTPLLIDSNPRKDSGFGQQEIRLPQSVTSMLESVAKENQITINTLVQGAWALLLSRYSGETDVAFGATRACRRSSVAGADNIVGLLINTLPVRVNAPAEQPLIPWLKDMRSQWVTLRDYEHTPLVKIQGWSEVPGGTSLFDSLVMFENQELNSAFHSHSTRLKNLEARLEEQTNFPLTLLGFGGSELLLKLKYDRCRFDDAKVSRMLGHLETLLSSMAENPWQCLGELPLLTTDERYQMLIEWNHTETDYQQHLCMHQLFEKQVTKTPDAIAVVFGNEQLTYKQLNTKANQLAHHLKHLGVKPGVLVGVYLERSLEMIPAVLGILKAGGAYVPLEPSFPQARIQLLLSSLEINCLVTQTHLLPNIHELEPQLPSLQNLICLDKSVAASYGQQKVWNYSELEFFSSTNPELVNTADDVAYVIFTSGSTGTPKGVVVRHQPAINLIEWVNKTFHVSSTDRVLFITSLCFDLSVYDIFGLLAAGGSIRVVSKEDARDPERLLNIVCHEPITFWDSAPPALQQLASLFPTVSAKRANPRLRLVFMSGDWIPVPLPEQLKATFPGVEVISLGGATEATIWSNYYPIKDIEPHWVSIPYGKPIQNAKYYILDSFLNPCPIGVTGELYIGGECLASGYLNQQELTAQKFIPNPFIPNKEGNPAKLYKTGDLARYFPDGNIEFLGRIDHQVKIRGFRIELGEIESVLLQHEAVQDAVVMAREDEPGNKRLVAYVVVTQASVINELRRFLQEKLPEYMVPSAFVAIDSIPLTANGKVDRRALPIPDQVRTDLDREFVSPSNSVEVELTEIWEQVLGVQPIGITDNFFDLGGHSILAVKLFAQVEKKFAQKLPLATLFQAPTIQQLATLLNQTEQASWSSLVKIRSGDNKKKPLFFIHALGGNIIGYQTLIRHLSSQQPIYGLQAQGLDGKQAPHTRVEDMACHYIQEIRKIQPHGPYLFAGFSSGGTIAYEMAQQLTLQGEKIDLLAMFDTYNPQLFIQSPCFSRTLYSYMRTLVQMPLKDKWHYFQAKVDWIQSALTGKTSSKFDLWNEQSFSEDENPHNMVLIEALKKATMSDYAPQPYSGNITLFTTKEVLRWCKYVPERGWKDLAQGGVEIHPVTGTHLGMLDEANVPTLATKFIACLEQAQTEVEDVFVTTENAQILNFPQMSPVYTAAS
ncbi:amino acid adenylation domain-containing protein [Calothrix sp. PCC 6303]|uniref:amino acid adenylation domain-containing protein n=1 Tax=Calothrix sp. PCC 6303 TaxID=1170562 RepID=UPI0002A05344|nr:non-ribosomal peptide synthetase [Calothrix sp. PCC 6303]AFZ00786.1 amino acid adenylation domain protein [Calothrix sp. PCC 6303]